MYNMSHRQEIFLFFLFSCHNVKRTGDRSALNKHLYHYYHYYYYYYYFGGVRSKGLATLRNVSKLQFFDKIGHKQSLQVFASIRLFDEVRAELVRDISRLLRFL